MLIWDDVLQSMSEEINRNYLYNERKKEKTNRKKYGSDSDSNETEIKL